MPCSGEYQALQAGEEAPRCPRCDRLMPEGECNCEYAIKPSPLSGVELVVVTEDPDAIKLLRSLRARFSRAYGWFITPKRAAIFELLWKAEVVPAFDHKYRFPDGTVKSIHSALRRIREMNK